MRSPRHPISNCSRAACPRFVEFVEAGITSGPELFAVAEEYLAPLKAADIDTLVLGCTHYPLMSARDPVRHGRRRSPWSRAPRRPPFDVYRTLVAHDLERHDPEPPTYTFEATGPDTADFMRLAHRFLGPEVVRVDTASLRSTADTGAIALGNQ